MKTYHSRSAEEPRTREERKQAQNIIANIRKILLNCDLTINYAKAEIRLREATMELHRGSQKKHRQRAFIDAKVDKERFEIFIEEIESLKNEVLQNLEIIFDKYTDKHKQVFLYFFLQQKSYDEIAELTNYSKPTINYIVSKLKEDILTFYY